MHSKLRSLCWFGLGLALATRVLGAPASQGPKTRTWERLSAAMTLAQVDAVLAPAVGSPLIVTRSRGGRFEVWTYDRGGQVVFVNGTLQFWTVAKPDAGQVSAIAQRQFVSRDARDRASLKQKTTGGLAQMAMNP